MKAMQVIAQGENLALQEAEVAKPSSRPSFPLPARPRPTPTNLSCSAEQESSS
jgi:hypothetical protein